MFDNLGGVDKFFLFCAVIGGSMFLMRSILLFVGLGGEDLDGGDLGDGVDLADGDGVDFGEDGTPTADFKMLSLHSLTAFLLMFGLMGFLIMHHYGEKFVWLAAVASLLTGLITMFIIAKLFSWSRKLQSDGTIYPKDTIGCEGSVYLGIPPGGIGKIRIVVNGALKVFDARCNEAATHLKTGDRIKVVDTGDVLVVEKN